MCYYLIRLVILLITPFDFPSTDSNFRCYPLELIPLLFYLFLLSMTLVTLFRLTRTQLHRFSSLTSRGRIRKDKVKDFGRTSSFSLRSFVLGFWVLKIIDTLTQRWDLGLEISLKLFLKTSMFLLGISPTLYVAFFSLLF